MEVRAGYKQTVLGALPNDWVVSSVGKSFEVLNHLRLPISQSEREKISGPYPYFGPTSVQGWIHNYRVEGTHALIGEDGDHFLKWSSHPMTLLVDGKFNVNNHAHVVKGVTNETSWFYWYFLHRDLTAFLTRQGASRYKLTKAVLLDLPCVIPPQKEQQAIANVLSDVDTLIAGLEKLIAKKRDLKQAAMQQLLTCQTRLPGFSEDWHSKMLGDIAHIQKGQLITTETLVAGSIPVIAGGKKPAYFHNKPNRLSKTITVSASGASAGYVAFHRSPIFASDCSTISEAKSYCIEFLYFSLQLQQEAIYSAQTGGAQPHIQPKDLSPLPVILPIALDEQQTIAKVLCDMEDELAALESRLAKTCDLKQGMMQELLTGRTRLV
jgi:type I restriction enzyme, S subunit